AHEGRLPNARHRRLSIIVQGLAIFRLLCVPAPVPGHLHRRTAGSPEFAKLVISPFYGSEVDPLAISRPTRYVAIIRTRRQGSRLAPLCVHDVNRGRVLEHVVKRNLLTVGGPVGCAGERAPSSQLARIHAFAIPHPNLKRALAVGSKSDFLAVG